MLDHMKTFSHQQIRLHFQNNRDKDKKRPSGSFYTSNMCTNKLTFKNCSKPQQKHVPTWSRSWFLNTFLQLKESSLGIDYRKYNMSLETLLVPKSNIVSKRQKMGHVKATWEQLPVVKLNILENRMNGMVLCYNPKYKMDAHKSVLI